MNHRLITDLVNKINDHRCRTIDNATDLLDDPNEIRAVLFAVIASDINALIDALAYQDEIHPKFAKLDRPYRVMAVMGILASLIQEGKHPGVTPQGVKAVTAAVKELHTPLKFERMQ
jgi:hypothetical protein